MDLAQAAPPARYFESECQLILDLRPIMPHCSDSLAAAASLAWNSSARAVVPRLSVVVGMKLYTGFQTNLGFHRLPMSTALDAPGQVTGRVPL